MRQYQRPLAGLTPNPVIAGRPYQVEAIKRITEAMEGRRRKFLLVMATGTGKTRTAIALVDLLFGAIWVQRVLFLADRRELVRQAIGDFKEYLPGETYARIEGGEVDDFARVHVATYPSMMSVYEKLSPAYYDLIIADESHRTIYSYYGRLFDHFDAMQLGLTATPTDYIDHNTFRLFECEDGRPTFYFSYEAARDEGYLARYKVLDAQTNFQIKGIKSGELPPEMRQQIEAQGIDLADVNFEGTDLERRVTNTGTHDAMVQEFMRECRKDATGTKPAKSIIFAMSHHHAKGLWESFNRLYPDLQAQGMVEIIDSFMERPERLLDDFKRQTMPRVAISVDMLDTGVDVPAAENLVFAKPVFSYVKFWQMIGRGTRLFRDSVTGKVKDTFLIIDHWNNFAYFGLNPEGETPSASVPLPVRLFRARLEKLLLLRGVGAHDSATAAADSLRAMLSDVPRANVNVQPHVEDVERFAQPAAWVSLGENDTGLLSETLAPLTRFLPSVNLFVMTFETRVERLAIAHLGGDVAQVEALRQEVERDLRSLPGDLREVAAQADKLAYALSDGFWEHLDYARIMSLQETFAPLMRFRQRQVTQMIELDLPDMISRRRWITFGLAGEGAFAETYREQVEARVREIADSVPALRKLRAGQTPSEDDVADLAEALNRPDFFIQEEKLREVYEAPDADLLDFMRHILNLAALPSREAKIRQAFEDFIAQYPAFNAAQVNFLRAVRAAALRRARLSTEALLQQPYLRAGDARHLFTANQLDEIVKLANQFV
jgi:type I restriction enzyme R subunit